MASRRTLDKRRSCLGKKRYRSRQEAQAAADDYILRFIPARPVDTYRCRHGDHFHIGHSRQRFSLVDALRNFPMRTVVDQRATG